MSRGKQFEKVIETALDKLDNCYYQRLYDTMMIRDYCCDYICYSSPHLYLLECKSLQGNRLNFKSHISEHQWNGLMEWSEVDGVYGIVIAWFVDHDVTVAYDIRHLHDMQAQGEKSVTFDSSVGIVIPGTKKRTYFDYDLSKLIKGE